MNPSSVHQQFCKNCHNNNNKNKGEKVIVILSGGVDSTTLLYDVISQGYDVTALSFAYGQKHIKELEYAQKTCEKLNIPWIKRGMSFGCDSALTSSKIDIPEGHYEDENMKSTVVPYRNLSMLVEAAVIATSRGAKKIFYGAHGGDHAIYPDCRKEFVDAVREVIKLADYSEVDIQAPYLSMDKGDIVNKGKELNVDYSLTWTCYKGLKEACGKCGSCTERIEAFEKAGIKDPIKYIKEVKKDE